MVGAPRHGRDAGAGGCSTRAGARRSASRSRSPRRGSRSGATIENTAELAFQAATTGVPSTVATAPATTAVLVPDLAIGKSHAPDAGARAAEHVHDHGRQRRRGADVRAGDGHRHDRGARADAQRPGHRCRLGVHDVPGRPSRARAPNPLTAGSDYPPISIPVLVSPGAQPGQLSNTATPAGAERRQPRQQLLHRRRRRERAGDRPARREGRDQHAELHADRLPLLPGSDHLSHRGDQQRRRRRRQRAARGDVRRAPAPSSRSPPRRARARAPICNLGTIAVRPGAGHDRRTGPRSRNGFAGPIRPTTLLDNTATVSAPVGNETSTPTTTARRPRSPRCRGPRPRSRRRSRLPQPVAGGPVTYTLTVHSDGPGTVDLRGGRHPPGGAAEAPGGDLDLRRDRRLPSTTRPARASASAHPDPDSSSARSPSSAPARTA